MPEETSGMDVQLDLMPAAENRLQSSLKRRPPKLQLHREMLDKEKQR